MKDRMEISLEEFFEDANIFITGGTGFIGKLLIEKLLRSQTNIRKLYLLMRTKKGKSEGERANEEVFSKPIFEQLRNEQPQFMRKISIIPGDILKPELGLCESDKKLLFDEVDIVFHCAAQLNMRAPLKENIRGNVGGAIEVLGLCRQMKHLKSLVVTSTAYSNCDRSVIEEKIYSSPISPQLALGCCELDDTILEKITPFILGGHPNTYTFSKAILENMLRSYNDLPIIIFRPAIVIASYLEPLPGWVENLTGPTGLFYSGGMGLTRVIMADLKTLVHWVPADMCTNALIVSSWHGFQTRLSNKDKIPIYNYSFNNKRWTVQKQHDYVRNIDIRFNQCIWKPIAMTTHHRLMYFIIRLFVHTIPAFFLDLLLALYGHKFRVSYVYKKKIHPITEAFSFFTTKNWIITEDNTYTMWKSLTESEKKRYFFDSNAVNMDEWMRNYAVGIKVFVAKERMEDNHLALRRHKILTVIHYTLLLIFWSGVLWILFTIFRYFQ